MSMLRLKREGVDNVTVQYECTDVDLQSESSKEKTTRC